MATKSLTGIHILLVEDEPLIAMDVEQVCLDHGAEEIKIVHNRSQLARLEIGPFDAAILDRFIDGETTLALARRLRAAGIPFIFTSGYTDSGELAAEFPGVSIIQKPYSSAKLVAALATSIQSSRRV